MMVPRRVWYRGGYANERDGCCLITKITGGVVVSTTAFGHHGHPRRVSLDGPWLPPVAYTAVALPRLCRRKSGGGYHWGNCYMRRIDYPFSCAGLAEVHEHIVCAVLAGKIALAGVCASCPPYNQPRGPALDTPGGIAATKPLE